VIPGGYLASIMGKTENQLQGVLFCFENFEKWNRMQFFFFLMKCRQKSSKD
jgi:hypothetical protein